MGIDLGDDAVTAADSGDTDTGANDLQNYPVITSAVANNSNVSISGTLNSIANKQFDIDFYSSPALSQQGNAEGQDISDICFSSYRWKRATRVSTPVCP